MADIIDSNYQIDSKQLFNRQSILCRIVYIIEIEMNAQTFFFVFTFYAEYTELCLVNFFLLDQGPFVEPLIAPILNFM